MRIICGLQEGQDPASVREALQDLGAETVQGPDLNNALIATFPDDVPAAPEATPGPDDGFDTGILTPNPSTPGIPVMPDLPGTPEPPAMDNPADAPATSTGDLIGRIEAIPGVRYAEPDAMQFIQG